MGPFPAEYGKSQTFIYRYVNPASFNSFSLILFTDLMTKSSPKTDFRVASLLQSQTTEQGITNKCPMCPYLCSDSTALKWHMISGSCIMKYILPGNQWKQKFTMTMIFCIQYCFLIRQNSSQGAVMDPVRLFERHFPPL